MDIEEIKTLTAMMVDNDLSEVMIRDGEKRIVIRRGAAGKQYVAVPAPVAPVAMPAPVAGAGSPAVGPSLAAKEDPGLSKITSPMVGTFYAAPDPESPPFVRAGDVVSPDSVICVIEAMKVFNEIKAEISGTIESVMIQSGTPVEFGQVLMTVRVG